MWASRARVDDLLEEHLELRLDEIHVGRLVLGGLLEVVQAERVEPRRQEEVLRLAPQQLQARLQAQARVPVLEGAREAVQRRDHALVLDLLEVFN